MVNEQNFCIGPWSEIQILPDGQLNWCHFSYHKDSVDNIDSVDLDTYFNGLSVQKIRDKLSVGENIRACEKCYNDETKVIYSYRRRRNVQMAIFPLQHFSKSYAESPMPERIVQSGIKPYFYNIVLGNLCNLSCVMCNPYYSSRVATDFKRIQWGDAQQQSLLDWTQNNNSWQKFLDHIDSNPNIVCVHFQGGEPLIHSRFREFLQHCVDIGHVNFHLTMVTNGTVYDSELIELFGHFLSCQIEISVETMTPVNSYIRYPVVQSKFDANLQKFLEARDHKISVVLRTVPQLLSVLDYVSVLEFGLQHNVCVDSNILAQPLYLRPAVWSDTVKQLAVNRLQEFKSKLALTTNAVELNLRNQITVNLKQNADIVLGAIAEPVTDRIALAQKALDYFSRLDQIRKLQSRDFCPELDLLYE